MNDNEWDLVGKACLIYFSIFSLIYLVRLFEAFMRFAYRNSDEDIDIALVLISKFDLASIPGMTILKVFGAVAIITAIIWIYQVCRKPTEGSVS